MKTLIYIRTSTTEQNPQLQLSDIYGIGAPNESEVIEEQQSAFSDKAARPKFDSVIQAITNDEISAIYVWHLDRIYRNRNKLVAFIKLCQQHKVLIYSVNQKWLNDIAAIPPPFNEIVYDLLIQILGWIAEEESRTKSNRIKMAVRKENGKTVSYKGNQWGSKSTIPEDIKAQISTLLASGLSCRQVAYTTGVGKSTISLMR